MLIVKEGLQIIYKGGRLNAGDELTDKILKRYPHLKKHGEEKSSKKAADPQKG